MKSLLPLSLLAAITLTTGCAYNGTLKSGFYSPPANPTNTKLPLTANLVCGDFFKTIVIDPGHVYGDYSVHLKTDPALQDALTKTCESLFEKVDVSPVIDPQNQAGADIVLLPNLGIQEHTLTLTLTAKAPVSGEVIQQYSASDTFQYGAPACVHILDTLDIFACGGLAFIIVPCNTSAIGHKGEDVLKQRLSFCLGQIAENIRNDPALVKKARASRKTP